MNTNKHEMSDDELDHFFRESAEKMDFDFDPDSWTKMSKKLDAVALPQSSGQGTSPWPKRSLLLLIGLLVLVGGYFSLKPSINQPNQVTNNISQTSKNETPILDSKKYVTTNKVDTDNFNTKENITTKKTTTPLSEDTERFEKNNAVDKTIVNEKSIAKNSAVNSKKYIASTKKYNEDFLVKNSSSSTIIEKKLEKSHAISAEEVAYLGNKIEIVRAKNQKRSIKNEPSASSNGNINIVALDDSIENNIITQLVNVPTEAIIEDNRPALKNLDLLAPKSVFTKSSVALPAIAFENSQPQTPVLPKSSTQFFKKGLYFRIGISPDLSLVTTDELTKLGSNSALLIEYRFSKRLSVQSGVLRSMKYYDTYPESYEWPYNWPSPPKLIDINATCKMLDIPLNIRYDISQKPHSRWFVSFGATSYIMLNEKYVYNYENPYDPKIKWKTWQGKTGTYYLGVLNFSMGYEYQLFRKLSIQAEPFFKMPIVHVGFGKVNLSTLGLLVSAKYPIFTHK